MILNKIIQYGGVTKHGFARTKNVLKFSYVFCAHFATPSRKKCSLANIEKI